MTFVLTTGSTLIPMGFFVLATAYFSLKFLDHRKTYDFVLSLIFSGCAFATKYNSVLVMILPSVSLIILYLQDRKRFNLKWLALLPLIPFITFFICMPYALIDTVSFLTGIGFELRHYKVYGHGEFTVVAGIRHIRFQATQILNNIGIFSVIAISLGLFASFKKPKLLFVAIFPIAYFFYMTTTIINFHRNFLIIYPFLAVGYAGALYIIWQIGEWYTTRINPKINYIANTPGVPVRLLIRILLSLLIVNVLFLSYASFQDAKRVKQTVDSRTLIVDKINMLGSANELLIPNEIRMHEQDLRRLKQKSKEVSLRELFSCAGKDSNDLAILPDRLFPGGRNDDEKALTKDYPGWIKRLDLASAKLSVGEQFTSLDHLSINPKLYVFDRHTLAMSNSACHSD